MTNLYFECTNGISGDMAVAALIDLGASTEKLDRALKSINLNDEFSYKISKTKVNSIQATDFDVILNSCPHEKHDDGHGGHAHHHDSNNGSAAHHHHHRNLADVNAIIKNADMTDAARTLAKKIFQIVAEAEAHVHGLPLDEVHFHEVGAIDSIADILSFAVLYDDINPKAAYFRALVEGTGTVKCRHGVMSVPVPAVLEIVSKYKIPLKLTDFEGEMITPTGAAIAAALYTGKKLPEETVITRVGRGAGKRPYPNPVLRVLMFE